MRKLYPFLFILIVPVILILMSNSNGSVGGKTGSVGDNGTTCTQCHSGTANPVNNWITTDIPPEGYTPGNTYTIIATGTHPGVVKFGFELTVENNQGAKVGTLQLAEPARTKFTNSNHAVTHTAAGNVPAGNTNSWTMNWVAPSGVLGNIGIYAAFNAANGNGNTSGDVIYKSSTFISEAAPAPLLASIVPDNGEQGETINTTISGTNTNFSGSPIVYLSFSGNGLEVINATDIVVISATVLQATFNLPASASPGLWDLHVNSLVLADCFTVQILSGIAVNEQEMNSIYPNPASSRFFIENVNGAELSIYSLKGEMLTSVKVTSQKQEINISHLSRGLYLVKILTDGMIRTEKLFVI
jgi:hypothetical protein